MMYETKEAAARPDAIAPDGSEVRLLSKVSRGGLATFTLPPQAVSRAVAHRTVEEVWYVISGRGRIWRQLGEEAEITELRPGLSLGIPTGTRFQFRCDGFKPLIIVGATMPPWPGDDEAYLVEGTWPSTFQGL